MQNEVILYSALAAFALKELYSVFSSRAREDRESIKDLSAGLMKTQVAIEAIRSDLRFFARLRYDLDALWIKERERYGSPRPSDVRHDEEKV